jgi:hypothetical protein
MNAAIKAVAAAGIGIGIIFSIVKYSQPPKYDQHEAVKFGISAADFKPGAAKELIEYQARNQWPNDPRHQRQYVQDAMSGYWAEQKFQKH